MSIYDDPKFKKLQKEWASKLKESGFDDLEDSKENLKPDGDRRTVAFENRDAIRDYYRKVDSYLTNTKNIPKKHRKVLELYSEGTPIEGDNGIAVQTGLHYQGVHFVIKKYQKIILNQK